MGIQGHTLMSSSSQEHIEVYCGIQGDELECKEETYLVEHGDLRGERSFPLHQHMDLGDYLLSSISHMSDDRGSVIDHQYVESPTVVHDGMRLVWSPGDYSPWMLVDESLVKPLGLTKGYDTSQSYTQLQVFLLAFSDTFIIYNNIGKIASCMGHGELLDKDLLIGDTSLHAIG